MWEDKTWAHAVIQAGSAGHWGQCWELMDTVQNMYVFRYLSTWHSAKQQFCFLEREWEDAKPITWLLQKPVRTCKYFKVSSLLAAKLSPQWNIQGWVSTWKHKEARNEWGMCNNTCLLECRCKNYSRCSYNADAQTVGAESSQQEDSVCRGYGSAQTFPLNISSVLDQLTISAAGHDFRCSFPNSKSTNAIYGIYDFFVTLYRIHWHLWSFQIPRQKI